MIEAYTHLHELGFAHSVETWHGDALVGGMYGVSLGAAFFGESMFTLESDASKIALYTLLRQLDAWRFRFLDCQMTTPHVRSLGAVEWTPGPLPVRAPPRTGGGDAAGTLVCSWPRCDGIGFVGRRVLGRW